MITYLHNQTLATEQLQCVQEISKLVELIMTTIIVN